MRRAVPPDVRAGPSGEGWTRDALVAAGVPEALAKRILAKRALWLTRTDPSRVAKCHVADLRAVYNTQGLDLVELRAVYASLPRRWDNDGDGKKQAWAEGIREKLAALLRRDDLPPSERRHGAWASADGLQLPFDDHSFEADVDVAANGLDGAAAARADELETLRASRANAKPPSDFDLCKRVVFKKPQPKVRKLDPDDPRVAMLAAIQSKGGLFGMLKAPPPDDAHDGASPPPAPPPARADLFAELRSRASI